MNETGLMFSNFLFKTISPELLLINRSNEHAHLSLDDNLFRPLYETIQTSSFKKIYIFDILYELGYADSLIQFVNYIKTISNAEIKIIYNICDRDVNISNVQIKNDERTMYIGLDNPFACLTYLFGCKYNHSSMTTDLTSDKFLFLPGKFTQSHRIGLFHSLKHNVHLSDKMLYKLSKDHAITSCDRIINSFNHVKKLYDIPHNSIHDYVEEFENSNYVFDFLTVYTDTEQHLTAFEVIAETFWQNDYDKFPFFKGPTEKTFRPIINNSAFVHISFNDCDYRFLADRGYKTFLEYVDIPYIEYDSNEKDLCGTNHINIAVRRIQNFLENLKNPEIQEQVKSDIMHNKSQLIKESIDVIENKIYMNMPELKEFTTDELIELFIH